MVCWLLLHMAIASCMHVYVHLYDAVTIVLPNYTVNSLNSYIANSIDYIDSIRSLYNLC